MKALDGKKRVKQQKHHAETRDPPSQDPRDHMAQADRHNNSPIITSKQTTTTPRRNESGEKKGETDSETRANVRRANVKRTVKQPSGCAQSPLSSAFPIIILLGNFLCSALVVSCIDARCKGQALIALSSAEAEFYGLISSASHGLGEQSMLKDWGICCPLVINMDATSGIAWVKHIDTSFLKGPAKG